VWLEIDGEGALHQQVYRGLRGAILAGRLAPATRLPSTRTLARELGVSRNTVLRAYDQLLDEGYVEARLGAGTFIAEVIPDEGLRPERPARDDAVDPAPELGAHPPTPIGLSQVGARIVAEAPAGGVSWSIRRRNVEYDFRYGEPAYLDLPHETWCRLVGRHARRAGTRQLAYGGPLGSPELRSALARYLGRARGVSCTPDQIILTHGSQQAIDLVARVLVDPGDRVAIEEPHYTGISLPLAAAGAESVPIPVDDEGLPTEEIARREPLRGVFITPSHQFPSGGVMPLARRLALLSWAETRGAFVLEDDYDGEFRYEGKPIPSLQSLDRSGTVLYVGSASKLLFPSLRIGWLVVPESLVRAFELAKAFADTGGATLEQRVLAEFIEQGHLERHVRRSRVRHGARRSALKRAVERHLPGVAELRGMPAGLHGVLWVPDLPAAREAELRRRCERRSVGIYPVHPYYTVPPSKAGYLLGYAALSESAIDEGVRRIAESVAEL
jgi:GntR family transcriptional regulator/MocR family aminotransferase